MLANSISAEATGHHQSGATHSGAGLRARPRSSSRASRRRDDALKRVAARMFELMREHEGVGLAAPQVGLNIRLFVINATGEPEDDRVYVNPVLTDADGDEEAEEGCLSLPDMNVEDRPPHDR